MADATHRTYVVAAIRLSCGRLICTPRFPTLRGLTQIHTLRIKQHNPGRPVRRLLQNQPISVPI